MQFHALMLYVSAFIIPVVRLHVNPYYVSLHICIPGHKSVSNTTYYCSAIILYIHAQLTCPISLDLQ